MKKPAILKTILLTAFILIAVCSEAQFPGGQGGPPPGGRRPGGRPPMGDRNREWNQNSGNTPIRQKKRVREGDTFSVVRTLGRKKMTLAVSLAGSEPQFEIK